MKNGISLSNLPTHTTINYPNSSNLLSTQNNYNNANKNIIKKVKFNYDVEVFNVESYKEHNKLFTFKEEEEIKDLYDIEIGKNISRRSRFSNLKSYIHKSRKMINNELNNNNKNNNFNNNIYNKNYFNNNKNNNFNKNNYSEKSDCCCIIY